MKAGSKKADRGKGSGYGKSFSESESELETERMCVGEVGEEESSIC